MKKYIKCAICGKEFSSYNPNPQFCSKECKSISQTASVSFNKAKRMYEEGMTQVEIAAALSTTQKVIYNLFRRNGYKCRVAAKRDQRGEKNHMWKGTDAVYSSMHERVYNLLGHPCKCEICGATEPSKRYEWANVTGDYNDVNGYKRMCVPCHRKFDKSEKGVKINVKFKHQ